MNSPEKVLFFLLHDESEELISNTFLAEVVMLAVIKILLYIKCTTWVARDNMMDCWTFQFNNNNNDARPILCMCKLLVLAYFEVINQTLSSDHILNYAKQLYAM